MNCPRFLRRIHTVSWGSLPHQYPFAADIPVGALLVALHGLFQTKLQVSFGFPNLSPADMSSVFVFFRSPVPAATPSILSFSI